MQWDVFLMFLMLSQAESDQKEASEIRGDRELDKSKIWNTSLLALQESRQLHTSDTVISVMR